jgi:hypothetical protein
VQQPLRAKDKYRGVYARFNVLWAGDKNVSNLKIGWHWQDRASANIYGPFVTSEAAFNAAEENFIGELKHGKS